LEKTYDEEINNLISNIIKKELKKWKL
jgi:hypothetical protein